MPGRRAFVAGLAGGLLAPGLARAGTGRTQEGGPELVPVGRVATDLYPKSVARAPDGRLWVCHFGRADGDNVWVYEPERLERVGVVEFEGNAVETAFGPGRAYVSNFRRGVVHAIDPRDHRVLGEVWVGPHPKSMLVSPSGHRLYAANYSAERVSIVDTETLSLVRHVRTGVQPRGLAMRPDGSWYVASFRSRRIQHYDADGESLGEFRSCPYPRHLQLAGSAPDALYVTCSLGSVSAYDATRGRRTLYAVAGGNPRTLGLSADGRWAASANFRTSDVTLVDTRAMTHRACPVPGASRLVGLALVVEGEKLRVWATGWDDHQLHALEADVPPSV
ncbi:MAG: YncE family protein [Myxococcota bacterium]